MKNKQVRCKNSKIFTFNQNKRAQMKISFGMIFSIILIIIFIAFAVWGIGKFLGWSQTGQLKQFSSSLQNDIDDLWQGSGGSQEVEYIMPSKVKGICFIDDEYENMYVQVKDKKQFENIEHVDLEKTLGTKSQQCFAVENGRIYLTLERKYEDALVTIKQKE